MDDSESCSLLARAGGGGNKWSLLSSLPVAGERAGGRSSEKQALVGAKPLPSSPYLISSPPPSVVTVINN